MKIGLLTFHDNMNFGAFLQSFALYKTLKDMGYECSIIDYRLGDPGFRFLNERADRIKFRPRGFWPKDLAYFIFVELKQKKKYDEFQRMLSEYVELSARYYKENIQDAEINEKYDVFLAGSDILWNHFALEYGTTYFLDFVKDDKKKYSFATSIGTPWTEEEKKIVAPLLSGFQRITLREKASIEWVKEVLAGKTEIDVQSSCDPTMLIKPDFWLDMAKKSKLYGKFKNKKYVLMYFDNDTSGKMLKEARLYARRHKIDVYIVDYGYLVLWRTKRSDLKSVSPYSAEDFLALILNAEAVFTSSFHGGLFSLYFERPLYYYNGYPELLIRFQNVIQRLNIQQCARSDKPELNEINIDYDAVRQEIEKWREESKAILASYWK